MRVLDEMEYGRVGACGKFAGSPVCALGHILGFPERYQYQCVKTIVQTMAVPWYICI
jgi:hypothetical protein